MDVWQGSKYASLYSHVWQGGSKYASKYSYSKYSYFQSLSTIMVIIFWDFLVFYQMFLSPQMKPNPIISNRQGIYELSQELPNDLRN